MSLQWKRLCPLPRNWRFQIESTNLTFRYSEIMVQDVVTVPLSSNRRLFWFRYSGFKRHATLSILRILWNPPYCYTAVVSTAWKWRLNSSRSRRPTYQSRVSEVTCLYPYRDHSWYFSVLRGRFLDSNSNWSKLTFAYFCKLGLWDVHAVFVSVNSPLSNFQYQNQCIQKLICMSLQLSSSLAIARQ
jgi:hypothetical protein